MFYLKYTNSEEKIKLVGFSEFRGQNDSARVIQVKFENEVTFDDVNINGFLICYTDTDEVYKDYSKFTTLYKIDVDKRGFQYSDDGSTFIGEDVPEYVQPSIEVSISDARANKVAEMNMIQQDVINKGTPVVLSDGHVEQFTATDADQRSLAALQAQVMLGSPMIPWHNSDHEEGCKYYSNSDMNLIIQGVVGFVTFEITRFRDLRRWINSLNDIDSIMAVDYYDLIPEEYQSEVLKDLYAQMGVKG